MTRQTNVPLVLALWAAGLGASAQFGKMSVLYEPLGASYGGGVAFLVSVVGLVGLVFGTTAGLVIGRIGLGRVLLGGLVLGAALSAIEALLPPWPVMLALRMAEGVSHLCVVVVGPALMSAAASPRHQGPVMALWSSFFGVSFALTAALGVPLASAWGSGALFLAHAAYMAAVALLLWRLVPLARGVAAGGPRTGLIARHLALYRSPTVAAPALGFVFYTTMYVALLTLFPALAGGESGRWLATLMPLTSTAVSLTLAIGLLTRIHPVRLCQAAFLIAALTMVPLWSFWPGATLAGGLALAVAMGLAQSSSFAAIPALNADPEDRTRAAGAMAQLGNLGSVSGTPALALMTGVMGVDGLALFVLPLALGGIAMNAWQAERRRRI